MMRFAEKLRLLVIMGLLLLQSGFSQYRVLVYKAIAGFDHTARHQGGELIDSLGGENGFTTTITEDASLYFNDDSLARFAVVVFMNNSGTPITSSAQTDAFERYIQAGGGMVGVHGANTMMREWAWYGDLLGNGAWFWQHPAPQDARYDIEDRVHPAMRHFEADTFWTFEEIYSHEGNPREAGVQVLMTVDETTYTGGGMGADHPTVWCHQYDGGRVLYTAFGHFAERFTSDAWYHQHLLGAIEWAAGAGGAVSASWKKTEIAFGRAVHFSQVNSVLHVESSLGQSLDITLMDSAGRTVESFKAGKSARISLAKVLPGVYYCRISSADGKIQAQQKISVTPY